MAAIEASTVLHWSGVLIPAKQELTDSQILDRYSGLLKAAVSAFREDPSYIVEMAEASAKLQARRGIKPG